MKGISINLGRPERGERSDSIIATISRSDYVLAVISPFKGKPARLKVIKNRHDGQTGEIEKSEAINILIKLIAQQAFSNTSGLSMYEEMLRNDVTRAIHELLDKYNVKEEAIDYIRETGRRDGFGA